MARDVWTIFRREYRQRVRSKAFVIATLGIPVLMIGMIALSTIVAASAADGLSGDRDPFLIGVVDSSGVLAERLRPQLAPIGYGTAELALDEISGPAGAFKAADSLYSGVLVLDPAAADSGSVRFYAEDRPSSLRRAGIANAVRLAVLELRSEASGESVEPTPVDFVMPDADSRSSSELSAEEEEVREGVGMGLGFGGGMVLYMTILLYAAAVLRATLEEKQSRVVEIIISTVRPTHLMMGKIFGVGGAGLTQLGIWLATVAAAAMLTTGVVAPVLPVQAGEIVDAVRAVLPGWEILPLFMGFFLFGYFIYGGLYAAVGAMCSSEQEAQYAQMPIVVLMVAQVMILMPVIEAPDSTLAIGASLFPMFSPVLMWARVATGSAAGWEIGLSFLFMALALLFCAWLAGRIYRIGILSTGKRPSLRELAGWVIRG